MEKNRTEKSNGGAGLDLQRRLVTCRREKETLREPKGISSSSEQPSDFLSTVVAGPLGRSALLTRTMLVFTFCTARGVSGFCSGSGGGSALLTKMYFCMTAAFFVGGLLRVSRCSEIVLH